MSAQNSGSHIISIALRGVAMVMAVAAVVIGMLKAAPAETIVSMLGIGLFALARDAPAPRAMSIGGVPMRSIREWGRHPGSGLVHEPR